jgi:biopolymer transport protein ExbD
MTGRYRRKRAREDASGLDVTTFLNLMVVLIPFLLISAVFSRVTILELSVPTGAGAAVSSTPNFAIEVIVRDKPGWRSPTAPPWRPRSRKRTSRTTCGCCTKCSRA